MLKLSVHFQLAVFSVSPIVTLACKLYLEEGSAIQIFLLPTAIINIALYYYYYHFTTKYHEDLSMKIQHREGIQKKKKKENLAILKGTEMSRVRYS